MPFENSDKSISPPGLWVGQGLHAFGLLILLAATAGAWNYLGRPQAVLFWAAVSFPVIHQVFVWLAWRFELRSGATSRAMGFLGYVAVFFLLFGGRFVLLVALAWKDSGTLHLGMIPRVGVTAVFAAVGLYAGASVQRYFGMKRASGADHFDPSYRTMPMVKEGIFKYTSNGMYLYAFLLFWAVAVGFDSSAALVVAAFSHAYIWLHYLATEKPDMEYLYQ